MECGYIDREATKSLYTQYNSILGMLVTMINNPDCWTISSNKK